MVISKYFIKVAESLKTPRIWVMSGIILLMQLKYFEEKSCGNNQLFFSLNTPGFWGPIDSSCLVHG